MSVGKVKQHDSAKGHVTGAAVYTDDLLPPSNLLVCLPVCANHAYAKLTKLETSAALNVPGVHCILTAKDVPGENDSGPVVHDEVLLPTDTVYYWGQAVAWVVAENEDSALAAINKVEHSYEELTPVLTLEEAITKQSFHGEPQLMQIGDAETVLKEAENVLEGEVYMNGQDHFYLETHASWVIPDGEGNYQVYASTQHPTETQVIVARVLGIDNSRVVVTNLRMGGGFGGKETQANPYAAIAALAAYKTGRPAKVRLRRWDDMTLSGKRHPFLGRYKTSFDDSGKLTALDLRLYSDGGWSSDLSHAVMQRAMFHSDNAYHIPNLRVKGYVCKTHKTSQTAFRGFGGPQGMIVIEDIMSRVAGALGIDADKVRERNFYKDGDVTHYRQQLEDVRTARIWQELKERAEFEERKKAAYSFNQQSQHVKRGLALTPVKFGISFTTTFLNQAGAFMLIYTDGSIQLNHGGTEMGQGLHIKMLQVAAQSLGVSIKRFRMMPTSTDKVPNTSATAASSGTDLNGQAVKNACETLKARLTIIAAAMLEDDITNIKFENDTVYSSRSPAKKLSFEEVVAKAYLEQTSLSTTGYYRTPNIYFDKVKGEGRPFHYFAYGAAMSEVEVDGFTGVYKLRRVDIVHDVGTSLNPLVDKGQIEGGFVQGMGWLTMEELVWDDAGQLRTVAPSTYKIPTVSEIPEAFNLHMLERAAQEGVIYGSKAVGEPPFMLAMSVREALRRAVSAFGASGYVPLALPATPEKVLEAIDAHREASKDKRAALST